MRTFCRAPRELGGVFIFGLTHSRNQPHREPTRTARSDTSPNAAHISVSGGFNTRVTIGQKEPASSFPGTGGAGPVSVLTARLVQPRAGPSDGERPR